MCSPVMVCPTFWVLTLGRYLDSNRTVSPRLERRSQRKAIEIGSAEGAGFEPASPERPPDPKSGPFDRSGNPPLVRWTKNDWRVYNLQRPPPSTTHVGQSGSHIFKKFCASLVKWCFPIAFVDSSGLVVPTNERGTSPRRVLRCGGCTFERRSERDHTTRYSARGNSAVLRAGTMDQNCTAIRARHSGNDPDVACFSGYSARYVSRWQHTRGPRGSRLRTKASMGLYLGGQSTGR